MSEKDPGIEQEVQVIKAIEEDDEFYTESTESVPYIIDADLWMMF